MWAINKWVWHTWEDEVISKRKSLVWQQATSSADAKQHLTMEEMVPCHWHQLSSLVDMDPSVFPKLSAGASFHSSNEGSMDSKSLDYIDLHLQFLAPCSCLLRLPKSLLCSPDAKRQ